MFRIRFLLLFLLAVLLSGCTVGRFFIYNFADTNDHKKFPARALPAAPEPFHYAVAEPPVTPRTVTTNDQETPFEEFLEEHKTVAYLIIRRDTILYERYFRGYDPSRIHTSFSMAKSVIGMLVGKAVDDGFIRDAQQPVTDFVPEMTAKGWDGVTIEQVLRMTSGMDFSESYTSPFGSAAKFYYGRKLRTHTTKLGLKREPGSEFHYMSGNSQLLGLIVERALRAKGDPRTVTEYLNDALWQPLGMEFNSSWSIDRKKNGMEKTFCCLNAPARDFAKLGSLYLHKGEWRGQQLISEEWVERSIRPGNGPNDPKHYGYQIWLPYPDGTFQYQGILGQYVYVDPNREMVVVRLGKNVGKVNWTQVARSVVQHYAPQD